MHPAVLIIGALVLVIVLVMYYAKKPTPSGGGGSTPHPAHGVCKPEGWTERCPSDRWFYDSAHLNYPDRVCGGDYNWKPQGGPGNVCYFGEHNIPMPHSDVLSKWKYEIGKHQCIMIGDDEAAEDTAKQEAKCESKWSHHYKLPNLNSQKAFWDQAHNQGFVAEAPPEMYFDKHGFRSFTKAQPSCIQKGTCPVLCDNTRPCSAGKKCVKSSSCLVGLGKEYTTIKYPKILQAMTGKKEMKFDTGEWKVSGYVGGACATGKCVPK